MATTKNPTQRRLEKEAIGFAQEAALGQLLSCWHFEDADETPMTYDEVLFALDHDRDQIGGDPIVIGVWEPLQNCPKTWIAKQIRATCQAMLRMLNAHASIVIHALSLPAYTLEGFCAEVNRIEKEKCDRLNAEPDRLFAAQFCRLPEEMLQIYWRQGYLPQEALDEIEADAEAERRFEALAS